MIQEKQVFDVIVTGGSYAGLSAALSLGRALRRVLVIDSGMPCNRQTPRSHNFITHDGEQPHIIARKAKTQVLQYPTVTFINDLALSAQKNTSGFDIQTRSGQTFRASRLIFATGIRDIMPDIRGFAECWGISAIHCPYCHGYEYSHQPTGILANGDQAFELSKLISNWTSRLTLFTNGTATLSNEQRQKLALHHIPIVETKVESLEHTEGLLRQLVLADGSRHVLNALYSRLPFEQHCPIPAQLGCIINEQGFIQTDAFQKTTVPGVLACGDSTGMMRSVASAVAGGALAGAMANRDLIEAGF